MADRRTSTATQQPTAAPAAAAEQLQAAFERARASFRRAEWEALHAREVGHFERAARLAGHLEGLRLAAEVFGVALPEEADEADSS